MIFIRRSPFGRQEDAARHMITLLGQEAERHGSPLSETDKEMLASESDYSAIPDDFRIRSRKLIEQILQRDIATQDNDRKSFIASCEWAGDNAYPVIVALTEEVITSGGVGRLPPLHGRNWIKDRAQLLGCGILMVVIMLLIVVIGSLIFERK